MEEETKETKDLQEPQEMPSQNEPKPAKGVLKQILTVGGCIVVGGIVFVLLTPICTPVHGASRSARLRFERRTAEIEQAIQEDHKEAQGNRMLLRLAGK